MLDFDDWTLEQDDDDDNKQGTTPSDYVDMRVVAPVPYSFSKK